MYRFEGAFTISIYFNCKYIQLYFLFRFAKTGVSHALEIITTSYICWFLIVYVFVRACYLFILNDTLLWHFRNIVVAYLYSILLGDFTSTLLMFVQYYWISDGAFIAVLLIPPPDLLSPFLAGFDALFSQGPKRYHVPHISTLEYYFYPCWVRYGYAPKCIFVLLNSLMQLSDKICLLFMYTSSQSPIWSQLSMLCTCCLQVVMLVLSSGWLLVPYKSCHNMKRLQKVSRSGIFFPGIR